MLITLLLLAAAVAAPVPLALDHDLFRTGGDGPGPWYKVEEAAPARFGVEVQRAPDALRVRKETSVAIGVATPGLAIVTAGAGGLESKGLAAEGELRFADGRVQNLRWLVGEHAWPAFAGATGRRAEPMLLGRNPAGDSLTASVLRVVVSWPEVPIAELVVRARSGLDLFVLAVVPEALPVDVGTLESVPPGYRFDIPLVREAVARSVPRAVQAVQVRGEGLAFADGTPARFWGVNLVGKGALPESARAESVALGLARRGYDLVRLHHIDTEATLVNPERVAGGPAASPAMLDRLDRLHAALRAQGISQFVEMWTLRSYRAGEGPPDPADVPLGHKYAPYYWPEWREAQKAWFREVWGRTNPHTGLRYADDPAVAFVELSNEDGLLLGWHTGSLEKLPTPHRRKLDARWNDFLRARYGSDAKIEAAWRGSLRPGLEPGETLAIGTVAREPVIRSRTELYPTRRAADLMEFYAGLEAETYAELRAFVRDELGFRAPLVCGTAMNSPAADRQLAACDVVDVHAYWDPIAESTAYYDTSLLDSSGRWFERLSACQVGKPCTLSEVQHSWPNRYGQEAPLVWASLAARQGIDAVMWFAWSHADVRDAPDGPAGALDLEGRWSADAQSEVAAALYRQLPEAEGRFVRWWSDAGLARDLAESGSVFLAETVSLASYLQQRVQVAYGEAPPASQAGASMPGLRLGRRSLVVDLPELAAVVGSGEGAAPPRWLEVRAGGHPAVSLLRTGPGEWLLTQVGRTDREGSWWRAGLPGMLTLGAGPALLERLSGAVTVRELDVLRAVALRPDGSEGEGVRLRRGRAGWRVPEGLKTPWLRLSTREGSAAP